METIKINEDDVHYAIKRFSGYNDAFANGIVNVFNNYLEHKDFKLMRNALETVPTLKEPLCLIWDLNTKANFLEVIYPVTKGGL